MTNEQRNELNERHTGLVVVKTAANTGENAIYDTFADYVNEHPEGEAHKVIEVDLVDELKGIAVTYEINQWGVPALTVGTEEMTLPQFFRKYQY